MEVDHETASICWEALSDHNLAYQVTVVGDGVEVLQAIRRDTALKTLPEVMLTSSREAPDLKRAYELGANAYVVEPVDFRDFIEAVKQVGVFWAVINEPPTERT